MIKLSLVIPCYNEAKSIPQLLKSFADRLVRHDIEVILVNNGSRDESQQVLQDCLPHYPFARSVTIEHNQGYGYGILKGLEVATGSYLGWTHADLQTDAYDAVLILELMEKEKSHCLGHRIFGKGKRQGRKWSDLIFTVGMGLFESLYLGTRIFDINAQPNIFHRSFFETWKNPPYDFSLDLYVYYWASKENFIIIRKPVSFPERIYGTSHWNIGLAGKWKMIKRTLSFSYQLKRNLQR